jgi:hypothetical protein
LNKIKIKEKEKEENRSRRLFVQYLESKESKYPIFESRCKRKLSPEVNMIFFQINPSIKWRPWPILAFAHSKSPKCEPFGPYLVDHRGRHTQR